MTRSSDDGDITSELAEERWVSAHPLEPHGYGPLQPAGPRAAGTSVHRKQGGTAGFASSLNTTRFRRPDEHPAQAVSNR
jgi:hypothetical protein